MPRESRWFVKTGLCYLAATFLAGGFMLAREAFGSPVPPIFGVEHAHLGMVGWLVNTVIGIALWMLPLNRARFAQTQGRYPRHMVVASFALLNGGLVLRLGAEPWYLLGGGSTVAAALLVVAAIAQPLGVAIFIVIAWFRVRPGATASGSQIRAR